MWFSGVQCLRFASLRQVDYIVFDKKQIPEIKMSELIFLMEEAPEGGYTARALGESIVTEADSLAELRENIRDAVRCHFEEGKAPRVVRLHFVRDEILHV